MCLLAALCCRDISTARTVSAACLLQAQVNAALGVQRCAAGAAIFAGSALVMFWLLTVITISRLEAWRRRNHLEDAGYGTAAMKGKRWAAAERPMADRANFCRS